jgi:uncharacterized membrane protein YgaE (UPF0421/DUF939 family)
MLPEVRSGLRRRLSRVRRSLWAVAQTALAAAIAWALASLVNDQPFFAPISAVISLGVARGRRTVRAFELVLGVAVGIAVADLIVLALGTGTLVIALVVALAMLAALLVGAGTILVNQAAVSAILVATLTPPSSGITPDRFVDALIGGGVALLVGQVLFPRDPLSALAAAARPVIDDLARALDAAAQALADGDEERARRALELARAVDADLAAFFDAVTLARETRPVLTGRSARERLPAYAAAAQQMEAAVGNTRVLTRRVLATVERDGAAAAPLAQGVALLGEAVRELGRELEEPGREVAVRRLALRAAATASTVLGGDPGLSSVVIVGQIRSTAIDLLRGSGMEHDEARAALEAAAEDREPATDVAMRTVPRPGARDG